MAWSGLRACDRCALPQDVTLVRRRLMGATMTSQVGWWTAFAIGVVVMLTRRALL